MSAETREWWTVIVRAHPDPSRQRTESGPMTHQQARREALVARAAGGTVVIERRRKGAATHRVAPR